jgi:hypothetical protein
MSVCYYNAQNGNAVVGHGDRQGRFLVFCSLPWCTGLVQERTGGSND